MDKIHIRDLALDAIIGTLPRERTTRQKLILNITLSVDSRKAGQTDDLSYAVDYSQVESRIVELVEKSSFQLLEALAEHLAEAVLAFNGVSAVRIMIDKPAAAARAAAIALEIEREKP